MIEVSHVTKKYGNIVAVDDLSFSVKSGEILGFLGPNGAGKSTTMNMLTGYISSTAGSLTIGGIDILEDPVQAKSAGTSAPLSGYDGAGIFVFYVFPQRSSHPKGASYYRNL